MKNKPFFHGVFARNFEIFIDCGKLHILENSNKSPNCPSFRSKAIPVAITLFFLLKWYYQFQHDIIEVTSILKEELFLPSRENALGWFENSFWLCSFHVLVIKTSVTKPVEELNQSTPTDQF